MTEDTPEDALPSGFSVFDAVRIALIVIFIGLFVYYMYPSSPEVSAALQTHVPLHKESGETMGTTFSLILAADVEKHESASILETATKQFDAVDQLMSTFRADSDVSRFNASQSTDWIPVSPKTAACVAIAQEISQKTDGAFDVSVNPFVQRWDFGSQKSGVSIPKQEEIDEIKKKTGFGHLQVRLEPPALKKDIPQLTIDLSGVAKGFGVDEAAASLIKDWKEKAGIFGFLIEIGGETLVYGNKGHDETGNEKLWILGIQKPNAIVAGIQRKLPLKNMALATSGGYNNFREKDGKRFSHIIDPRTGFPTEFADIDAPLAEARLVSVSVLEASCAKADAFATALFVLGPEKGLELAEKEKLPVLFLLQSIDGSIQEVGSSCW